jgi:hypothetical protein
MITTARIGRARRFKSREDEIDYRLIYAISFVLFLVVAIGGRIADWSGIAQGLVHSERKSILKQAKSDASSAVAFAFMQ